MHAMSTNDHPSWHNRRNMRLVGYDYRQSGAYFLTICVRHRYCYLGLIHEDRVRLSVLGDIAREEWERTPVIRPGVVLDAFVVMPNHLHAVVVFPEDKERSAGPDQSTNHRKETNNPLDQTADALLCVPTDGTRPSIAASSDTDPRGYPIPTANSSVGTHSSASTSAQGRVSHAIRRPARSLGSLVAGYKVSTTKRINDLCGTPGAPFWQSNYYKHVIRSDADLDRIRLYIEYNPLRWHEDEHNLDR